MLPGMSIFGLAGMGMNIAGNILQAEEFGNQVEYEKQVLDNNSRMVIAASIRLVVFAGQEPSEQMNLYGSRL